MIDQRQGGGTESRTKKQEEVSELAGVASGAGAKTGWEEKLKPGKNAV